MILKPSYELLKVIHFGGPKVSRAISILLTAISICSRQFQFHSWQFQVYSRQFRFILGNFSLLTAISISRAVSALYRLFQEPITRSEQLPCDVVTHFPFVPIAFFSLSVEKRFSLFELSFKLFPLFLKTQILNGDKSHIVYSQERFWLHSQIRPEFVDLGSWSIC